MQRESVLTVNTVVALVCVGVLVVYSAGTVQGYGAEAVSDSGQFRYLWGQLARVGIGLAAMLVAAQLDYHVFRKRVVLWSILGVVATLLLLVLVVGEERHGARRWLVVFGQSIQPSDLARIAVVVVLAVKLSENQREIRTFWRGFLPPSLTTLFFAVLIALEPDIGTPVVIGAVAFLMIMMAGANWLHLVLSVGPAAALVGLYVWLFPHAQARIYAYRVPWQYRESEGYQLVQSLWAFARGGLWGQGPGASQQKLDYLPFAHSDFIFAVWGEETGLVGTLFLVFCFGVFIILGMRIAVCARDLLGALLAAGITSTIALQATLSMAVTTGLLPTKGLTLPFISAGGTALIVNLTMVGILLNVSSQAVERDRPKAAAANG